MDISSKLYLQTKIWKNCIRWTSGARVRLLSRHSCIRRVYREARTSEQQRKTSGQREPCGTRGDTREGGARTSVARVGASDGGFRWSVAGGGRPSTGRPRPKNEETVCVRAYRSRPARWSLAAHRARTTGSAVVRVRTSRPILPFSPHGSPQPPLGADPPRQKQNNSCSATTTTIVL